MLNSEYKIFKSGTDIRGVASEGVAGEPVNLTDGILSAMADGFILWACEKTGKRAKELTVSVGRDCRISGEHIASLVTERLRRAGARVYSCGLSSTPSMFMTTVDLGCDAAVQITASHHPFNRNGLKFFTRDGGLDSEDIEAILQHAQDGDVPDSSDKGSVEAVNYMERYCAHLREIIKREVNSANYEQPLKGFRIVVDAGNGAGGFYASQVLEPLGADTEGSRFLEPDGMFPNHIPNPENAKAMESICEAVLESKADLGVIFDTDVDRGGAVDKTGKEINRNRLVALAACLALENNPGGTVVTDSITSTGLHEFIENHLGGKHYRYRRGYKNVINKAVELTAKGVCAPLAIETSGHAAMQENYYLDDGAYLCTKIIIKAAQLRQRGESLETLLAELREPAEECEIRIKISAPDFRTAGQRVIEELTAYASAQPDWHIAPDNANSEGIRISFDKDNGDGWFLLRLSVHDPILPLNIESDSVGGVEIIKEKVLGFLKTQDGLDL